VLFTIEKLVGLNCEGKGRREYTDACADSMRTFVDVQEMTHTMSSAMPAKPKSVMRLGITFSCYLKSEKTVVNQSRRGQCHSKFYLIHPATMLGVPMHRFNNRQRKANNSQLTRKKVTSLHDIPSRASWENRSIDRYMPLQHACKRPLFFVCRCAKVLHRSNVKARKKYRKEATPNSRTYPCPCHVCGSIQKLSWFAL
jgi:hypothetical protein